MILLHPKSIAVIGASRDSQKVGHQILRNLLTAKDVKLYPVNPKAHQILELKVYPSVLDIVGSVDMAVIAVPVQFVIATIDECVKKGVKSIVLITAGFAESSEQGKKIQEELKAKLDAAGIQLLGPNTLGILNPRHELNVSFAPQKLIPGKLALISQSGALLTAMFTQMETQQIGCSFSVSLGNKAGLSENDFLEFADDDPQTKVIGLYLESFHDLPRFFTLCSQISREKPILLLKGGRSSRGQQASISHTAALATNDILLQAACQQFGITLVNTVEAFSQACFFLENQPQPISNLMIITNAGGPGVNTTDLCETYHVPLADWSKHSVEAFAHELPNLKATNPLDLIGDARADRYRFAIQQAQRDPNIDAMLIIITLQSVTNVPEIIEQITQLKGKKPILVALIGGTRFDHLRKKLTNMGIYAFEFPNDAIELLSVAMQSFRQTPAPVVSKRPRPDLLNETLSDPPAFSSAMKLLKAYGLKTPSFEVVTQKSKTREISLPTFVKTANLELAHKKDLGAIYGKVETRAEAEEAFEKMQKFGDEVLFQSICEAELELLVGVNRDPQFGLYLAFGLGGSFTNLVADRSYVFLPTNAAAVKRQIQSTKGYTQLRHLEKELGKDFSAQIVEVILSLQQLMLDHPQIQELEINPMMVNKKGLWAVDVKVKIG